MERRSRRDCSGEYVLDTSYLLPLVGIEVEGLERDAYDKILTMKLHFPIALAAELAGVIAKEVRKLGIDEVPEGAVEGFNSIVFGGRINLVLPEGEDVKMACDLIRTGWKDVFDALLYATAKRLGVRVLSMDREFKRFLREKGYDADLLVSHKDIDEH